MMSNVEVKKNDLIIQSLLLISSIYMMQFILVGLLPIYKIGFQGALTLIYMEFLHSQFNEEQRTYNALRAIIIYVFIFISIAAGISSISSLIISIEEYGMEFILKSSKFVGIWIYFAICFLQPIILPFPEPVTIMTGSAAFGATYGFFIGFSGTMAGIIAMFFIARIGGNKLVSKAIHPKQLERYRSFVVRNETLILIGLFILPILPDEVICVGAGVSRVSFKKFASIALLSKMITSFAYSQSLELTKVIEEIPILWLLVIVALVIGSYFAIKGIRKNKDNKYSS